MLQQAIDCLFWQHGKHSAGSAPSYASSHHCIQTCHVRTCLLTALVLAFLWIIQCVTGKSDFVRYIFDVQHILSQNFRVLTSFVLPYSKNHSHDDNGSPFPYLRIAGASGVDTEKLLRGGWSRRSRSGGIQRYRHQR